MLRTVFIYVALIAVFAGCRQQSDRHVVLSVNGHDLTEEMISSRANLMVALRHHRNPKFSDDDALKLRETFRRGYGNVFIRDAVLADFAKSRGISIPDRILAECRAKAFAAQRNRGDKNFEDMVVRAGVDRREFDAQIRTEALVVAVKEHLAQSNPTNFTTAYADDLIKRMKAFNADMVKTNALVYARATNVWMRLNAGADFAQTAKEFTEVPEEKDDCEWGILDDSFLRDSPRLLEAVKKLRVGEFTPPVEGDNALLIVRLDGLSNDGAYELSRIVFLLPMMLDIASREEIIETAYKEYYDSLYKTTLKDLIDSADIVRMNQDSEQTSKEDKNEAKR